MCGHDHTSFKSYMDYRMITNTKSIQYKMIRQGFKAKKGLMYKGDYVAIALGSRYGTYGDRFRITLDTGETFKAIKVDEKDINDVVDNCHHKSDGSLVEFVVDKYSLKSGNNLAYKMGDISYIKGFKGKIAKIEREV